MGNKSRGNWSMMVCVRECKGQANNNMCKDCIRGDNYQPLETKKEESRERKG